jgi:hypothetical protein
MSLSFSVIEQNIHIQNQIVIADISVLEKSMICGWPKTAKPSQGVEQLGK